MSDEAIEAAAEAISLLEFKGIPVWAHANEQQREGWREQARATITAYNATAQSRIERLEAALRPFAEGCIDVSGAAVIVGHPECAAALTEARAALKDDPA